MIWRIISKEKLYQLLRPKIELKHRIVCVTSTFDQKKECTGFGMIPVKKDIFEYIQMLSGGM